METISQEFWRIIAFHDHPGAHHHEFGNSDGGGMRLRRLRLRRACGMIPRSTLRMKEIRPLSRTLQRISLGEFFFF